MERLLGAFILILVSSAGLGCSACSSPAQVRLNAAADARLERVRRVAAALAPRRADLALRFEVIDSDVPGAYSWPDGRVAVTAGLVDALDDAELAAAVAHELGHLLNDGHLRGGGVAALKGSGGAPADVEEAADDAGVQLLLESHLSPGAMARMLTKVKDSPRTPHGCRAALDGRARRLGAP